MYRLRAAALLPLALVLFLPGSVLESLGGPVALGGLAVNLAASTVLTGLAVRARLLDDERDLTTGDLLVAGRNGLGALVVLGVLFAVPVSLGLLAVVLPGLLLWTMLAVCAPVLVTEGTGPLRALNRSRMLMQGSFFPAFTVVVALFVLTQALPFVLGIVGASIAGGAGAIVFAALSATILAPVFAPAIALLHLALADLESVSG